jgi:biotin operon repressor
MMSQTQKNQIIRLLKKEGVYIRYCRKDGYVYELIRTVRGQTIRFLIGLKNGVVAILRKDPVWGVAA